MKKSKAVLRLCLLTALSLLFTACGEEIARKEGAGLLVECQDTEGESKAQNAQMEETAVAPPLPGEAAVTEPQETLPHTTVPEEPATTAEQNGNEEFQAIRVQDITQSHLESLISRYAHPDQEGGLSYAHLASRDALADFLQEVSSAKFQEVCASYDDAFFSQYDLVVVPRLTNSGSVKHSGYFAVVGNELQVYIAAAVPEYGTADMAQWLLVMPIPKGEAQERTLVVCMVKTSEQLEITLP